jgi:diguanylate cyclase (GGDEF)-like protein
VSGFQSVNFGSAASGLFSPEEVARLMEREYQRSLRYGYPLALLVVEIDRLESLHDLYGVESEQRIVRAVTALLRSSTRPSDALGVARGQRMLLLLPHATRAGALAVAQRLLSGCNELEFRGDGRILRASLSLGLAVRSDEAGLEALIRCGELALARAVASGGGRVHEYQPEDAPVTRRVVDDIPSATSVPLRAPRAPAPLPSIGELPGTTLEEKVGALVRLAGGDATLEAEVLAVLQRTLSETRRPGATRAEVAEQKRVLEQRIAEQKRLLDASEEELARLVREKSVDPGIASLYRGVQGLDPSAQDFQKKRELLAVLYQANVELLKELERQPDPEP